jgi:hypothetical protein
MTKREITDVLCGMPPHPLTEWLATLIATHHVIVEHAGVFAVLIERGTGTRAVFVPHSGLVSDGDVASTLHEVAHALDPVPSRDLAAFEARAWLLAQTLAGAHWNAAMQASADESLWSHASGTDASLEDHQLLRQTSLFMRARAGGGDGAIIIPNVISDQIPDWSSACKLFPRR